MSTGFERIRSDRRLQNHWIRRLIAFLLDSVIVFIVTTIFSTFLSLFIAYIFGDPFVFSLIMGVFYIFYFGYTEAYYSATIGKQIMKLEVVTVGGNKPSLDIALLRNASKVHLIFLLLDVIASLATSGDPYQKITDRIAGTRVLPTFSASPLP